MSAHLKQAILHGLKVAGHLFVAAIVVVGTTLATDASFSQQVISGLMNFGVPAAIANILLAIAVKFVQLTSAKLDAEDSNTPPAL